MMHSSSSPVASCLLAFGILAGVSFGTSTAEAQDAAQGTSHNLAAIAKRPAEGPLEGCGLWTFHAVLLKHYKIDLNTFLTLGVTPFPCPGLSGGWSPDLHSMYEHQTPSWRDNLEWKGERPIKVHRDEYGNVTEMPIVAYWTCLDSYAHLTGNKIPTEIHKLRFPSVPAGQRPDPAQIEFELAWRWHNRKLHCFRVPYKSAHCYALDLNSERRYFKPGELPYIPSELPSYCKPKIYFVRPEAPYDVLKRPPFGAPFRIKLVFEVAPGRKSRPVSVASISSGRATTATAYKTDNPKVFLTDPIQ